MEVEVLIQTIKILFTITYLGSLFTYAIGDLIYEYAEYWRNGEFEKYIC